MDTMFVKGGVVSVLSVLVLLLAGAEGLAFNHAEIEPTETYLHSAEMDTKGNYFLFWKFDNETITFEAWVKTKGWVGLGLSPNGGMKGSDIFLGWVADGQVELTDRYAIGNQMPLVDAQQNLALLEGRETNQFTMLKFSRKLVTCDLNDRSIEYGTVRVLYAWNEADPASPDSVSYHGATQRGSRSLLLRDFGKPSDSSVYSGMKTFDLVMHNVTLPTKRTMYWCRIQEVPVLDRKHHVVRVEPLIEAANIGVVHHIVVYFCHGTLQTEVDGRECWEGNMPENSTKCDTIAFAWAVGQMDFHYPDEAGLSLGTADDPTFFNIEMHYDNPEGLSNVVDSSGLRLYYTDRIRQYDAATMATGTTLWFPPMSIPPKAEAFEVDAYCSADCTNKLPEGGINVFAVLLHTHLAGRKMWMKHIRNGKELPEIAREDHYDFNFQQIRRLDTIKNIQPGDELITTCVYNTMDRTNMTYGGSGTDDEMCISFMIYYPRVAVQACTSANQHYYPIHQLVMEKAMTGDFVVNPGEDDDRNVYKLLDKVTWDEQTIAHFQNQMKHTVGYTEACAVSKEGFGVFTGSESYYKNILVPKEPLPADDRCVVMSGVNSVHLASALSIGLMVALVKLLN